MTARRAAIHTLGVFHSFELARALDERSMLSYVLSTFPWARLQREGVPLDRVMTWPWLATPSMLMHRYHCNPPALMRALDGMSTAGLRRKGAALLRQHEEVDTLIALAGAGRGSGSIVQKRGGRWICDRGSTHIRYAERVLAEEFKRWGVEHKPHNEAPAREELEEYDAADCITVPSHFAMRTFVQEGVDPQKLRVIPYGVRLDSFAPSPRPPASSLDGEFNVLFAGALCLRKGVPCLLQAFAALNHPRKRLRLAGLVQHDLKQILHRLPQEQVELLGHQPREALVRLMQQSHCMVLPSLEEGLALVQGQALACGCPVIATPNTGAEDLFTDGVEGMLVPPRDVPALTAAMQQMAENPQMQLQMREAALRRVQTLGGWARYGEQWHGLLQGTDGRTGHVPNSSA